MAKGKAKWNQKNNTKKLQTVTEYCRLAIVILFGQTRKLKRIKQLKLRKHKYLYSKTANINKENVREMEGYREMGEIP